MAGTADQSGFSTGRRIGRREFGARTLGGAAALVFRGEQEAAPVARSRVGLSRSRERKEGLQQALAAFGPVDFGGADIYVKASFNSVHEFPATTSPEMLRLVVEDLRARGSGRIVLVERSGMGRTRAVWARLGIDSLARKLDLTLLALDELPREGWRREPLPGSHWSRGVEFPAAIASETVVVQICGCKTHRFGGQFSASLKNSIGLIARESGDPKPHNYMAELHGSADQRLMIAEVNQLYTPRLVIMDATQVFVDGGPEIGDLGYPEVIAVACDRVAIDAVALALLRLHGANGPVHRDPVFEAQQLKRAGELGLGAKSLEGMDLAGGDPGTLRLINQVTAALDKEAESPK